MGRDKMKSVRVFVLTVLLGLALPTNSRCSRRGEEPGGVTICFAFEDLETEFCVAAYTDCGMMNYKCAGYTAAQSPAF